MAYTYNPSTWKVEAGGLVQVPGQPGLRLASMLKQITSSDVIRVLAHGWLWCRVIDAELNYTNNRAWVGWWLTRVLYFCREAEFWRQTSAAGVLLPPQQRLPGRGARSLLRRAAKELCEQSPRQA